MNTIPSLLVGLAAGAVYVAIDAWILRHAWDGISTFRAVWAFGTFFVVCRFSNTALLGQKPADDEK